MSFKIVRNNITKMNTDAIVNTANEYPIIGPGCDYDIYTAAGYDELLSYRKEHIGEVAEGEAFLTPGFRLKAKYIIHAVSPFYEDGSQGEEEKLRACYRNSLELADQNQIHSIAFPLISTGGFGYPKKEGMRIAIDEIYDFLFDHEMDITLVVFDSAATSLGERLYPDLEKYIDNQFVDQKREEEYEADFYRRSSRIERIAIDEECSSFDDLSERDDEPFDFDFEEHESKLEERMKHLSDTFSEYLMYLIDSKGLDNVTVYKKAIVDKKIFSKIKNNKDYHPQKKTVLCLCIGAQLNLDETRDLLARAGYALSPCDKTDIIFRYFIENKLYDIIDLDIVLEEHGLPCMIA